MEADLTPERAMDIVFSEYGAPEIDLETEWTEAMYAARRKIPTQTANRHLTEAVKDGRLTRRKVHYNGARAWAYKLVGSLDTFTDPG